MRMGEAVSGGEVKKKEGERRDWKQMEGRRWQIRSGRKVGEEEKK